jgi:hypothetical protein
MNQDMKNILKKLSTHFNDCYYYDKESGKREHLDFDYRSSLIGMLEHAYQNNDLCPDVDDLCFDFLEVLYQVSLVKTNCSFGDDNQWQLFFESVVLWIAEIVHMLFTYYQYWLKVKETRGIIGAINSLGSTIIAINAAWLFVTSGEPYHFYWIDIADIINNSVELHHLEFSPLIKWIEEKK